MGFSRVTPLYIYIVADKVLVNTLFRTDHIRYRGHIGLALNDAGWVCKGDYSLFGKNYVRSSQYTYMPAWNNGIGTIGFRLGERSLWTLWYGKVL
jgi:hypothetical protein